VSLALPNGTEASVEYLAPPGVRTLRIRCTESTVQGSVGSSEVDVTAALIRFNAPLETGSRTRPNVR
jgi:hypothetical protein